MKPHDGPPTWDSKVRGLMLGLALGDAIGSKASDVPTSGTLEAGAATQLAAWTVEGMLRNTSRYGGSVMWTFDSVFVPGVIRGSYAQWAVHRGVEPWFGSDHEMLRFTTPELRGWLAQVPAMAAIRGSSPSTLEALASGSAVRSTGCQALLRGLPIAAVIGPSNESGFVPMSFENRADDLDVYSRLIASLTHEHPAIDSAVGFATRVLTASLRRSSSIVDALEWAIGARLDESLRPQVVSAYQLGRSGPCVPQTLERIAPDRSASSALLGGLYVALSFPERDTAAQALEFAGWAPDGDSVGAGAGALLGSLHGFEIFPVDLVSRLELGWVTERLAGDLARQMAQNQTHGMWGDDATLDPNWDLKYPGV